MGAKTMQTRRMNTPVKGIIFRWELNTQKM